MHEITLKEARRKLAEIIAAAQPKYSTAELVRRGEQQYKRICEKLEPQHNNKFVVIEVDSGDYFIDKDSVKATLKAQKKHPETVFYLARIGHPAAFSMKGHVPLL